MQQIAQVRLSTSDWVRIWVAVCFVLLGLLGGMISFIREIDHISYQLDELHRADKAASKRLERIEIRLGITPPPDVDPPTSKGKPLLKLQPFPPTVLGKVR